jgi:hypothetical protein
VIRNPKIMRVDRSEDCTDIKQNLIRMDINDWVKSKYLMDNK